MLLDSIRTQIDSLSKSEQKVARAVLKKPELAVAGNIAALANSAQVSEPTVVRFCRALGYDGWREFKLKLAQGLALAPPGADQSPAPDDLASDLVNKICSRSINTLLDLRNHLDPDQMRQARRNRRIRIGIDAQIDRHQHRRQLGQRGAARCQRNHVGAHLARELHAAQQRGAAAALRDGDHRIALF